MIFENLEVKIKSLSKILALKVAYNAQRVNYSYSHVLSPLQLVAGQRLDYAGDALVLQHWRGFLSLHRAVQQIVLTY